MEGKERPKNEAEHSRLVGSSVKRQGNLFLMLVLGDHKTCTSPCFPARILNIYIKSFTGSNHIYHPDGHHNTLPSLVCVLRNSSHCGNSGLNIHSKHRRQEGDTPIAQVSLVG